MKRTFFILRAFLLASLSGGVVSLGDETNLPPSRGSDAAIILPEPIPDPIEKINRRLWAVNEVAMKGVVKPSGKVYRVLVPPPFRIGFSNV
ncbi:MAG TPA: MlaA family lipoprotein, partial [Verrucomicrobiae bacterium]|nr:MlaA family lipoprotein [Verrucomicrobiae bacterium]